MKICMVTEFCVPYYNGGGEHRYYAMAKRLVELGHEVDMITMNIADNSYETPDGINIHHIGPRINNIPYRSAKAFIHYFFSVTKWILSHDYDVIDAQAYSPLLSATLSAKLKRTPIVGVIYDTSTTNNDQWLQSKNTASFMEKFLVKLPYDRLLTISPATMNSLVDDFNVEREDIDLLYCGVDIAKYDAVENQEEVKNSIIFIGRLAPHKHVDDLLSILPNLREDVPDVSLTVVGRGQEKEKLIELAQSNGVSDIVTFKQDLTDEELISEIKKSSILVLPSTREGFGLVLAEANCCSKPVVSYASGGTKDVVEDGYNGFLVNQRDIDVLEEKIRTLLVDDQLRTNMGLNGRSRVESLFDWNKITDEYVEILEKLINNS
ncbi:MAG: hypothetical protein BZ136_01450 [Methanosphaera sp. rholeuAM74]|nr:MAG: hypothetical protein BZ136_01450 [Methanosphaera sp. rholeuAM74]